MSTTDQQDLGQQIMITVNRASRGALWLNMAAIDEVLYDAFGQQPDRDDLFADLPLSRHSGGQPRIPQYARRARSIYVTAAGAIWQPAARRRPGSAADFGTMGQVGAAGRFRRDPDKRLTPLVITHQGQFPAITLSFNLPPGVSLGQALETLRSTQHAIGLPRAVETNSGGQGGGVRIITRKRADPDRGGHHRGLYRSRHSL